MASKTKRTTKSKERKPAGEERKDAPEPKGKAVKGPPPESKAHVHLERKLERLADLKPHPRNYRGHPADQLEHIRESIRRTGIYRNVVIAEDGTILAGHGVVMAAQSLGLETVPAIRLPIGPNDPVALKVLTGDNEIGHLGEIDDRRLSEILKEIKDVDISGLAGTGYDDLMLAALVMVTRPSGEIADFNEASQWVGMPGCEPKDDDLKVVVVFRNKKDRDAWVKIAEQAGMDLKMHYKSAAVWSTWWPPKDRDDLASVRFAVPNSDGTPPPPPKTRKSGKPKQ